MSRDTQWCVCVSLRTQTKGQTWNFEHLFFLFHLTISPRSTLSFTRCALLFYFFFFFCQSDFVFLSIPSSPNNFSVSFCQFNRFPYNFIWNSNYTISFSLNLCDFKMLHSMLQIQWQRLVNSSQAYADDVVQILAILTRRSIN